MSALGKYIRTKRELLHKQYGQFSIRTLAKRIGIHQSYLSKLERGEHAPLTEERIMALARELGEDHELLLALSGKLSDRVTRLIHDNPERFTQCLLELECSSSRDIPANTYTQRLEHRKQELETLTRMLRDEINSRVHLQHQLARAEAEKLTILSNLKDVVVEYLDRDFNLLWASPAISEYLAIPLEQAIGQKCYRTIMGRDSVCPECMAELSIKTGRIEDGRRTTDDGRHWQVRSVPIKDALGQVEKIVHFGFDITELIRTRDALAESERRWRFALEGAQEGVWDWDARTNKVFFSSRWKEMLGYAAEDIGDDLREWDVRIHPDDRREVYEILGRHLRGETDSYECEHRLRCKDGSYKWILDRGVVVERDPDNKPVRAIGTHFDVTDRREAEETIRRSEAFLSALLQSIQEGICVLGPDMVVQYVNPVLETWFAANMPLVGKTCHQAFQNRREPCLICPARRCLHSGQSHWDVVSIGGSGDNKSMEVFCYPIIDSADQTVSGVIEFVRDISDKRRMEEAVRESEARYRSVFEQNPTVQLLLNPDSGAILDCNSAACSFYGYTKDELCAKFIFDLNTLPPEEVAAEMDRAKAARRNFFQFKHRLQDGSIREIESRATVVPHGESQLLHSIIIDVTARNQALRDLSAEREQLEALIESIPDVICLKDSQGRWLAVNKPGRMLMGLEACPYKGKTMAAIKELIDPGFHDAMRLCQAFNTAAWDRDQVWRADTAIRTHAGQDMTFDVFTVPMFQTDGSRRGLTVIARDMTNLRRSEERQALLAAIIDNSPNICVIKDLDRRVVATNQAFATVAGKPLDELIGRTDAQIFGLSPDQPPVQGYMQDELEVQRYSPGQVLDREEEVIQSDGNRRLVHTRKFPVFTPHGQLMATANISVDITDKAKALARCSVLDQRCQDLIHKAPIGIYAAGANGRFLHINQAMAAMHGYTSIQDMQAETNNHEQLFARPEDWLRLTAILDRLGAASGFEALIRRQDGSTLWTSRTVRAARDAVGNLVQYEAFVENIQGRKEAELLSDHARRLLLGVMEQLEAGLYVVNPEDRRIMFANRYLTRAFGRDLTGLDAPQTLLKDPAQCQLLGANPAFRANGDTLSRELLFANDRWYLCAAKITPWIDTDRVILVVAVDVTQARQAATIREDMDRIMRHDLRSPLNGIINLPLMLAESSALNEDDRCLLQAISDSGRKMLRLIDSSLALYRLESGTYALDRGPLNLDEEFRKTEHELLHLVRAKQIGIAYEHHPKRSSGQPTLIHADTITVPFLISNLMKNAVEAAPDNTTVTVRIALDHDLEVAIHNSGEVPAEIQDRFFDKYTTRGKANGTGLGTYSARLIVRAHGGEITMTTSAGQGTTVHFTLPAVGRRHSTEEN
jgi:PAS domain S-box-containing protein